MSANVETMFYVREKPWHGLGTEVQEAPTSADALICAGLDWLVEQKNVYTEDGSLISGYKVNTRSTDNAALGIVSDRYKVVQNEDAFQFTDDLLGAGVTYETAGALASWTRSMTFSVCLVVQIRLALSRARLRVF